MRAIAILALSLGALSCSAPEDVFFRIDGEHSEIDEDQFWFDAGASLFELLNEGECADHVPILENTAIYTHACGLSEGELADRLSALGGDASWRIQVITRREYELALERNERMYVR